MAHADADAPADPRQGGGISPPACGLNPGVAGHLLNHRA
jgi:hypothetical protein